jgi:hypothetical protein
VGVEHSANTASRDAGQILPSPLKFVLQIIFSGQIPLPTDRFVQQTLFSGQISLIS